MKRKWGKSENSGLTSLYPASEIRSVLVFY